MTTPSKRASNQQQSSLQDEEYDEYIYYPYYPKSRPDGTYEYVQEPQNSHEYERPRREYYDEYAPNNSAPVQRT